MEFRKMVMITLYARQQETQMYKIVFWTLWEKGRAGWYGRMALKHVNYHMWNKSPVQVRCMIQGFWGWCTGMTQEIGGGGRWEGDSGWGTRVHPWRIHVDAWQNQYNFVKFKNKIKFKKKKKTTLENKVWALFTETWSPNVVLSLTSWLNSHL